MQKLAVLDRDGIVNFDPGYTYKVSSFRFIDEVFDICRILQSRGFLIAIATNQSGIERGYFSVKEFEELTKWIHNEFRRKKINLVGTFFCPHKPDVNGQPRCLCRKPRPGMLLEALRITGADPKNSIMIGDSPSDVQASKSASFGHALRICPEPDFTRLEFESHKNLLEWLNVNLL